MISDGFRTDFRQTDCRPKKPRHKIEFRPKNISDGFRTVFTRTLKSKLVYWAKHQTDFGRNQVKISYDFRTEIS